MAGDVGRVRRSRRAGGAERPLGDAAVLGPREDGAPVLELVHVVGGLVAEDLDRVLVAEVIGALDRVECVRLGIVLRRVSERRVDAALGCAGVAADGWIFESSATSAPASNASIAARMPAQPAPTMRTSCLASTTEEAIE